LTRHCPSPTFLDRILEYGCRVITDRSGGGGGAGVETDVVMEAYRAVLPSEDARLVLRAPDGAVVDAIVPRQEYPVVIPAREVFPVTPVAIVHRDTDPVGADGAV